MADTDVLHHRSKKLGMENCRSEICSNNDRSGGLHFHTLTHIIDRDSVLFVYCC